MNHDKKDLSWLKKKENQKLANLQICVQISIFLMVKEQLIPECTANPWLHRKLAFPKSSDVCGNVCVNLNVVGVTNQSPRCFTWYSSSFQWVKPFLLLLIQTPKDLWFLQECIPLFFFRLDGSNIIAHSKIRIANINGVFTSYSWNLYWVYLLVNFYIIQFSWVQFYLYSAKFQQQFPLFYEIVK